MKMKRTRVMAAAVLLAAGALLLQVAQAQQPGIKRTDLSAARSQRPRTRGDPSACRFRPGSGGPRALPSGQEIVYVVEGVLEYSSTAGHR